MNKSEIEVFISKYSNTEWWENFIHNTYWSTKFNYLFKLSFTSKQDLTDFTQTHNNVQIEHLAPYQVTTDCKIKRTHVTKLLLLEKASALINSNVDILQCFHG
jgi:hypothetical protein